MIPYPGLSRHVSQNKESTEKITTRRKGVERTDCQPKGLPCWESLSESKTKDAERDEGTESHDQPPFPSKYTRIVNICEERTRPNPHNKPLGP